MVIQYDEEKNHIRKHGISLLELATIFENTFIAPATDVFDVIHSDSREVSQISCLRMYNSGIVYDDIVHILRHDLYYRWTED